MPYTPTRWRVFHNPDGSYSIARGAIEYTCVDDADAQFLADVLNLHDGPRPDPVVNRVFEAAAALWGCDVDAIRHAKKVEPFWSAKRAACLIADELGATSRQIGDYLGKDSTTGHYHVREAQRWLSVEDSAFRKVYTTLKQKVI